MDYTKYVRYNKKIPFKKIVSSKIYLTSWLNYKYIIDSILLCNELVTFKSWIINDFEYWTECVG